jgi:hypothetical protein
VNTGRAVSSCSTSYIRRISLAENTLTSHARLDSDFRIFIDLLICA